MFKGPRKLHSFSCVQGESGEMPKRLALLLIIKARKLGKKGALVILKFLVTQHRKLTVAFFYLLRSSFRHRGQAGRGTKNLTEPDR